MANVPPELRFLAGPPCEEAGRPIMKLVVSMWFEHIQTVLDDRKRGSPKVKDKVNVVKSRCVCLQLCQIWYKFVSSLVFKCA